MASALALVNANKKRRKTMAKMASLYEETTRPQKGGLMTKYEDEAELCEYCGDTPEDCADAGECNYGLEKEDLACGLCSSTCRCDETYEQQREREADEFFDSLDSWH